MPKKYLEQNTHSTIRSITIDATNLTANIPTNTDKFISNTVIEPSEQNCSVPDVAVPVAYVTPDQLSSSITATVCGIPTVSAITVNANIANANDNMPGIIIPVENVIAENKTIHNGDEKLFSLLASMESNAKKFADFFGFSKADQIKPIKIEPIKKYTIPPHIKPKNELKPVEYDNMFLEREAKLIKIKKKVKHTKVSSKKRSFKKFSKKSSKKKK